VHSFIKSGSIYVIAINTRRFLRERHYVASLSGARLCVMRLCYHGLRLANVRCKLLSAYISFSR